MPRFEGQTLTTLNGIKSLNLSIDIGLNMVVEILESLSCSVIKSWH